VVRPDLLSGIELVEAAPDSLRAEVLPEPCVTDLEAAVIVDQIPFVTVEVELLHGAPA
jgi:hypothetical protein